jgi:hypothetical protein
MMFLTKKSTSNTIAIWKDKAKCKFKSEYGYAGLTIHPYRCMSFV